MANKQHLVHETPEGVEIRSDGETRRYYGLAAAKFLVLIDIFLTPLYVIFPRKVSGDDATYTVIPFKRGRALLVEEDET